MRYVMKFKKGDYFIIIKDNTDILYNGMIIRCIGIRKKFKRWKYYGEVIKNNDKLNYYGKTFPFNVDEVKKLSKEELMLELL